MKNIIKNVNELFSGKANGERYAPATRQYFFRYER